MNVEPHWTAYVSALLTPVVALFGIYIAWRQARTARNKLKLDLFDRRFAVYDTARKLLREVFTRGSISDEALWTFAAGIREARWLLNSDLASYLGDEVWGKAVDLQTYDAELKGLPVGDERSSLVHKRADLKKWFNAQADVLDAKFESFLALTH